jgi:hypothetical protein
MNSINNTNLSCGYNIWETTEFTLPGAWLNNKGTSGNFVVKTKKKKKTEEEEEEISDEVIIWSDTNKIPRLFILDLGTDSQVLTEEELSSIPENTPKAVVVFSNTSGSLPSGYYAIYCSTATSTLEGDDKISNNNPEAYISTGIIRKGKLTLGENSYKECTNNAIVSFLNSSFAMGNIYRVDRTIYLVDTVHSEDMSENTITYSIIVQEARGTGTPEKDNYEFVLGRVTNSGVTILDSNISIISIGKTYSDDI